MIDPAFISICCLAKEGGVVPTKPRFNNLSQTFIYLFLPFILFKTKQHHKTIAVHSISLSGRGYSMILYIHKELMG